MQEPEREPTTPPSPDPGPGADAPRPAPGSTSSGESSWSIAWRQLRKNRRAMLALATVLVLFGVAVFAPLLANGRPLYLRGYLTHLYETDVAAYLDWHERFRSATLQLQAGVGARERERLEEQRARYAAGLPTILRRIASALDAEEREALLELRAEYAPLLAAPPEDFDLAAYDALGGRIARDYGALSLLAAYKRAAAPLPRTGPLTEEVDDARAALARARDDGARGAARDRIEALAAEGSAVADAVEAGVAGVGRFLGPDDRSALMETAAPALRGLRTLADPERDVSQVRAATAALEGALDAAARAQVDPARQLLPVQTRWPAFAYLTAAEVGFIALYLTVLGAIAGRRAFLRLGPRGRVAVLVGPGLAAGAAWAALVPERLPPSDSLYKAFAEQVAEEAAAVQGTGRAVRTRVVFPPVPFGENENIYSDRETPPVLWELLQLSRAEGAAPETLQELSLVRRLREPGEPPITAEQAQERLTRLRAHWLGTDGNGRDILARLIIGSRVSLSVGFVAVTIYVLIGVVLGAMAGYFRGWTDMVISRVTEVVICFPTFFLIVAAMALVNRPSIFYIMGIIGLTSWTEVMRLVRGEFLRLGGQEFVLAGRALGLSPWRIVFRHILPNALGPVFVAAAFGVAGAILIESALSFLGFGVPQPQASWGSVLFDARGHEKAMWWVTIFPGLLIFVTITAYNLLGEGLRDALDPKLRQ